MLMKRNRAERLLANGANIHTICGNVGGTPDGKKKNDSNISGNLDFRNFGFPEILIFGFRVSGYPKIRKSGYPKIRKS